MDDHGAVRVRSDFFPTLPTNINSRNSQLFGRWQLDTAVTTVLGEDGMVKEAGAEETDE